MLSGVLIGESLRAGAELSGIPLVVTRLWRSRAGSSEAGQPALWTLMEFSAEDDEAEGLAEALSGCLAPTGGWYVNFNTAEDAFVVFAGKVFRYPRGDASGREAAKEHARSIGVPEQQLDWEE